jgi:hypothetical protein
MNTSVENTALPYLRRVVRKGPHLITCTRCFERKHAYVIGPGDVCYSCRASQTVVAQPYQTRE